MKNEKTSRHTGNGKTQVLLRAVRRHALPLAALGLPVLLLWPAKLFLPGRDDARTLLEVALHRPGSAHPAENNDAVENALTSAFDSSFAAMQPQAPGAPLPAILSPDDRTRYRRLFALARAGKWSEASGTLASLEDTRLTGYAEAEHLLAADEEFAAAARWLEAHSQLAPATQIYRLARSKAPANATLPAIAQRPALRHGGDSHRIFVKSATLTGASNSGAAKEILKLTKQRALDGAFEKLEKGREAGQFSPTEYDTLAWQIGWAHLTMGNTARAYELASASAKRSGQLLPAADWVAGLAAWQTGNHQAAAGHFAALASREELLSPAELSAAGFWAWRAHQAAGKHKEAAGYLREAASASRRSFYGLLAQRALGQAPRISRETLTLSAADATALAARPEIARVLALNEIGETEYAEQELRRAFPDAGRAEKRGLLALAARLGMPATQISMASALARRSDVPDSALYPLPHWQPDAGFKVDPALIFAIARHESGFRADALSMSGAMGVMQIMPETAHFLRRKHDHAPVSAEALRDSLNEPVYNITLGQHYLSHLLKTPASGDNLIFLLASYNAGPARIIEWKERMAHADPLLFLESIPFEQTRNYVSQVMASYWVYSTIAGQQPASMQALLDGRWPVYAPRPELLAGLTGGKTSLR